MSQLDHGGFVKQIQLTITRQHKYGLIVDIVSSLTKQIVQFEGF